MLASGYHGVCSRRNKTATCTNWRIGVSPSGVLCSCPFLSYQPSLPFSRRKWWAERNNVCCLIHTTCESDAARGEQWWKCGECKLPQKKEVWEPMIAIVTQQATSARETSWCEKDKEEPRQSSVLQFRRISLRSTTTTLKLLFAQLSQVRNLVHRAQGGP
jgi:hypothetical protein